jgi:hypothetical protein
MNEIQTASSVKLWENLGALRRSCVVALRGSAAGEQPALTAFVGQIDELIRSGSTDAVRRMFCADSDLWPAP